MIILKSLIKFGLFPLFNSVTAFSWSGGHWAHNDCDNSPLQGHVHKYSHVPSHIV